MEIYTCICIQVEQKGSIDDNNIDRIGIRYMNYNQDQEETIEQLYIFKKQ